MRTSVTCAGSRDRTYRTIADTLTRLPVEHFVGTGRIHQALRSRVRGMHDGAPCHAEREDFSRGIAGVKTGQPPRVALADEQRVRQRLPQGERFFDRAHRQDARGPRSDRMRRHGERAEDVDDHGDAASLGGPGDVVQDFNPHAATSRAR